jgi:threonine dehydratase
MLNRQEIASMHRLIAPYIRRTPVIDIRLDGLDRPVTLKLECLQVTGSFKARGAFANMVGLEERPAAGVTAASGGNHGIAVARAAATLGMKARIFVPEISSAAKVARIRQEGAEVTVGGARYADALSACEAYAAESGALPIHAYNAEATLLGQGTIAAELEAQANDLDTVMVAVGGGGLIGGIAAWYSGAHQILGIEPSGCNALAAALAAGGPVLVETAGIAADSLGASRLGDLSYGILAQTGAGSVLVEDGDIAAAQAWLWDNLRLITEPGGATALAPLLSGRYQPHAGERIGVVICGANVDPASFGTRQ